MKHLLFNRKGQAMVEMALILPILMLILLGITEFGRILGGYLEMQSTTRDLARYAAINNITTSSGLYVTNADGTLSLINEHFILLDPDKITVTVAPRTDAVNKNTWVEVTLNYSMDLMTPLLGGIIGDPLNMTSTMALRVE